MMAAFPAGDSECSVFPISVIDKESLFTRLPHLAACCTLSEMYLLYCDETNLDSRPGDFFIYGGLIVPSETALKLSEEIDAIRTKAKVPTDFQLKFNPKPGCLDHEEFKLLKQSLIEAAARQGCGLVTSVYSS